MDITSLIIIAIGLSFDSFAVSISSGLSNKRILFFRAVKVALFLAIFQALFPVFGWLIGTSLSSQFEKYDHWIAFILLALIGSKMIYDYFRNKEGSRQLKDMGFLTLVGISVATSIDALIVGLSFGFIDTNILLAAFIIGGITFLASMTGILFGKKSAAKIGRYADLLGGMILILIGLKILIEHTIRHSS